MELLRSSIPPDSTVFCYTFVRPARGTTRLCKLLILIILQSLCFCVPHFWSPFGHQVKNYLVVSGFFTIFA